MKEIFISALNRIASQSQPVFELLMESDPEALKNRPENNGWSVHETLAHLGRYQEVFMERIYSILHDVQPAFDRYKAEEDPEFVKWTELPIPDMMGRMKPLRRKIFNELMQLKPEQVLRTGNHPKYGAMNIAEWTEFFLLHEAHHLFGIFGQLKVLKKG